VQRDDLLRVARLAREVQRTNDAEEALRLATEMQAIVKRITKEKAAMSIDKHQQVEHNFTYHAPKPGQPERYVALRDKAKELAILILELTPVSREQSVALTELETCVFWSNAAIARHE
jgi:hypothetical protein